MSRFRKYGGIFLLIVMVLIAVQVGVSLLVRTHRMRGYLLAHLEGAFGRPVEAQSFSVQILPVPELDVEGVTISEDPAFGHEYFLRAEHMTASLRWLGLLRGHFQFGTMSLTRPSLILVRNAEGRWNLEDWLPPASSNPFRGAASVAPPQASVSTRLQKIEFDEGRISFKVGSDKRSFAFTGVSGSVEQIAFGRWRLQLEAEPWRSGTTLQSTGTIQVAGDVAGTSARLQPARLHVHWDRVSIADLFRLATGNDPGVRGGFALDGDASVGMNSPGEQISAGQWKFNLKARGTQIHRWDLTERSDNPRVDVTVKGTWNIAAGEMRAEQVRVESPRSDLDGSLALQTSGTVSWRAQFTEMSISGQDLLAWYRAFQPELAPEVTLDEWITGQVSASGWPLRWDDAEIEGTGGVLRVPEILEARISPWQALVRRGKFAGDVRLALTNAAPAQSNRERAAAKLRGTVPVENAVATSLAQDLATRQGSLTVNLRMADVTPLFKLTAAFGYPLNRGWDFKGGADGPLRWTWSGSLSERRRSGALDLTKARLEIAGLNQPLQVEQVRLEWKDKLRSANIGKMEGFGASWSGTVTEVANVSAEEPNWRFQLHADHLDATEFDRWFGPRARPNWLQRLLAPVLRSGQSEAAARASELLRRISAEGDLSADTLSIEKIKLNKAHATLELHALKLDVRDAEAQWAGGNVRGELQAAFSPQPTYAVDVQVERVNLAQLPWPPKWAERWSGLASGTVHLTAAGVGREELLKHLTGGGQLNLSQVELRGWDVESSAESGILRGGASRWTTGQGEFEVANQALRFTAIRLEGPRARTQLAGSIGFDMDGSLTFTPGPADKRGKKTVSAVRELRVRGPFEAPTVVVQPVSADGPGL